MNPDLALLIGSSAAGLAAIAVLATSVSAADGRAAPAPWSADPTPADGPSTPTGPIVAAAAGAAALVIAFTGWVAPALVVAVAAAAATRAWQRRERRVDDAGRTEALASWIENLRDVLVAGDQPIGAIGATVATCPRPIRPQVRRLAAGLGRQEPATVLRRFADDIDDPLGDLVAAGLLIAVERGARTVAVLTSLAGQARQQADRRRLVEAERAPVRREVGLLTVIMGSLVLALFVFGRAEYLAPYDAPAGQLFLAVVLAIYLVLLARVRRLARYPRPRRFLVAAAGRHTGGNRAGPPGGSA